MKAIVFDFNGTLFDDTRFHMASWQSYMFKKFGVKVAQDEVRRRFIGPNNAQIFRSFFGDGITEDEIFSWGCEKEREYRATAATDPENMHLIDGAEELFDLLAERGMPACVATSSVMDNVRFYMDDLGLGKWFTLDQIVYDDGTLAPKPDPAFYLEAARRMNVDMKDCIVVEDSPSGIQAAVNAGAGMIIAIDRSAPMDWLKSNPHIHAVIHDFRKFEQFL